MLVFSMSGFSLFSQKKEGVPGEPGKKCKGGQTRSADHSSNSLPQQQHYIIPDPKNFR